MQPTSILNTSHLLFIILSLSLAGNVAFATTPTITPVTPSTSTVTPSSSTVSPSSNPPPSSTLTPSSSTATPSSSTVSPLSNTLSPISSTVTPSTNTLTGTTSPPTSTVTPSTNTLTGTCDGGTCVSISTLLSATTITLGQSVHDSATLSGVTADAGGAVAYNFFSGSTCSGPVQFTSQVTVTNGVVPDSSPFTPSNTGQYSAQAIYSGDAKNDAAGPTDCTTEQFTVVTGSGGGTTSAVGGIINPVDMTSLLIAGVMTNAFWMVPTLGGVAAVITLFKVKKRNRASSQR